MEDESAMDLVVGATGFIGANLLEKWDAQAPSSVMGIDSSGWHTVYGKFFRRVVVAAPHARKWWANENPAADMSMCKCLIGQLEQIKFRELILISTVDAAGSTGLADNANDGAIPPTYYGRHRRWIEDEILGRYADAKVLRLPALFGPGLKKNALYDLSNKRELWRHRLDDKYQWYPLNWLSTDIERLMDSPFRRVGLATEPMALRLIVREHFQELESLLVMNEHVALTRLPIHYDIRSCFAQHWPEERSDGYMYGASLILDEMRAHLESPS